MLLASSDISVMAVRVSECFYTSCGERVSTSISYVTVVAAAAVEGGRSVGMGFAMVPSSMGAPHRFLSLLSTIRFIIYLEACDLLFQSLLY